MFTNRQALAYGALGAVVMALTGSKRRRVKRALVGGALGYVGFHVAGRAGVNLPALPV